MTKHSDLFAALAAPFEPREVKMRTQAGRQFHYITARTAMNRLDEVLGPENWWDSYTAAEDSVLCRLTIVLPDGQVVTKEDAGGYAGMADSGDDDKSGYSDAFKRAAVKFGVARYLYKDGVPTFVRERVNDIDSATPAESDHMSAARRDPGAPAPERVEAREGGAAYGQQAQQARPQQPRGDGQGVPRTGKALFAWTKDMEQRRKVQLLKYLNGWAKLQEFPSRMIDWDADQVACAYGEAVRKLRSPETARPDAYDEALSN